MFHWNCATWVLDLPERLVVVALCVSVSVCVRVCVSVHACMHAHICETTKISSEGGIPVNINDSIAAVALYLSSHSLGSE